MFSTFTKKILEPGETQHLLIPGDAVKRLEDTPEGCVLIWLENGEPLERLIEGTSIENHARLKKEELKVIEEHQRLQQRQSNGLPMIPVPRGKGGAS